jgi:hypothetical protein
VTRNSDADISFGALTARRLDPADVRTRNDAGDARVSALYYDDNALGLDHLGCDWHPSRHDHQVLADALAKHLATLPLTW